MATVSRVFEAPRQLVWRAWTEPEHFSQWFGTPPYTTPVETISMDLRPGGAWSATMVSGDDGSQVPFRGTYREVVEPERLVLTFEDVSDPDNEDVELLTVTFAEFAGETEVVASQTGHMPSEEYGLLEQGYSAFFDRLEPCVARLREPGA
jgi:uncharacterized protein YndB with AHSA1/START domain